MSGETLRVKFQRGDTVVELDGDAAVVQSQLAALGNTGYGRLMDLFDPPSTSPVPPAATPLVPLANPARTMRFVVTAMVLPRQRSDLATDIDGDGKADNQFGNIVSLLEAQGFDVQASVDQALAAFRAPVLLTIASENADLTADQRVDVTVAHGTVVDAGRRVFRADATLPGVVLPGMLAASHARSQGPMAGGAVVTVPLVLELFVGVPIPLAVKAAQIAFTLPPDGSAVLDGRINGAVAMTEIRAAVFPALATALSARVAADPSSAASRQILDIFDTGGCTNPDGTQAKAGDGVIDVCEVVTNRLVENVFAPDVQLFDGAGAYAPRSGGDAPDCCSFGIGFAALPATF